MVKMFLYNKFIPMIANIKPRKLYSFTDTGHKKYDDALRIKNFARSVMKQVDSELLKRTDKLNKDIVPDVSNRVQNVPGENLDVIYCTIYRMQISSLMLRIELSVKLARKILM